ncbi:MAG: hypothetical protein JWQ97_2567 [Phenylobacterium sp.]|nr:hypothetical protein [Phenylobacterium sp.]
MTISRLMVGVDVPWVTSWSDEPLLGVRPCSSIAGGLAVCQAERAGHGRPQYSRNHLVRQRRSVAQMLCPMCGEPTPQEDRWSQTARRTSAGALRARGLGALIPPELKDAAVMIDAGAISPLHRACAERSLAQCPHLSAMPEAEIRPFPKAWLVAPLMVEARPEGAAPLPGVGLPAALPVVSFLQLFGVTGELDKRWRRHLRRSAPA